MKGFEKAVSFLPGPILKSISDNVFEKRFNAVVAFADVSGFTKMSEKLALIGREGAEALTGILNSYFTCMIERINRCGGFVGKFGGDAMTIFFPIDTDEDTVFVMNRSVKTSLDLQKMMNEFQNIQTKGGTFNLGMKIGMAFGSVLFKVVGPEKEGGREYLLAGNPLDQAAEAEHHGVSGQVVISKEIADGTSLKHEQLPDNFYLVHHSDFDPVPDDVSSKTEVNPRWIKYAKTFIDPNVYNRMGLGIDSVGEIRRVSVIFMSFSGLDYDIDENVGQKLDKIFNWVYDVTSKFGGSINKVDMGDKGSKMIITFGAPDAHENDEELSVHCGFELINGRKRLLELGVEHRIGIATGVVFAGEVGAPLRQEYTVMGSTVNLAARQMAHCKSGQLIVDEITKSRAESVFQFSEPNFVQFKGMKDPQPTYGVLGMLESNAKSYDSARKPIYGREEEIKKINSIFDHANKNNLQIVILKGEAGTGKSRLFEESLDRAKKDGFIFAAGEALSYAKRSPYLVWISILRGLMKLSVNAKHEDSLKIIENVISVCDSKNSFRLPIVAALFGIACEENDITKHFDAQLRQENIYDFFVQYLKYLSKENPVLLIFEDSQWIDKNSLALNAYLIRNLREQRIVLLKTRRPYSRKFKSKYIAEIEKNTRTSVIHLTDLNKENTEKLILSHLEVKEIEEELLNFVYDASHGNPSFTEQMLENLKSLGRLEIADNDAHNAKIARKIGDLSDVEVPDSLSSLIMSLLDRLQAEAKLTVRLAAVIGRQFQEEILKGSYPVELSHDKIKLSLEELMKTDLIQLTDQDMLEYIFKNLLTLDVAYDSLLFAHRRDYHFRIGNCLEKFYQDNNNQHCEELARHFSQTDDDRKAILYLDKAGNKAFDMFANESAEAYLSEALMRTSPEKFNEERYKLLGTRSKVFSVLGKYTNEEVDLDERLMLATKRSNLENRIDCYSALAHFYSRFNRLDEMELALNTATNMLSKVDYPKGAISVDLDTGTLHFLKMDYQKALSFWEISLKNSEKYNDDKGYSVSLSNCGLANKALGDFDRALEYYDKSVENDRKIGNKNSETTNLVNIGVLYYRRGEFEKAMNAYEESLALARSIGSKLFQARVIGNLAMIYQMRGDREQALQRFEDLLEISDQIGFAQGKVAAVMNIGTWYLEYAEFDKALVNYKNALEITRSNEPLKTYEPGIQLNIGLTLHYQGRFDAAKSNLEVGIKCAVEIKDVVSEDFARRYLGFVLLELEEYDQAESEFKKAMEIGKSLGSKASIASAKIGLGLIELKLKNDRKLIDEGIVEAKSINDSENIIKGQIELAKILLSRNIECKEALSLLQSAEKEAKSNGFKNDLTIIEPLLKQFQQDC